MLILYARISVSGGFAVVQPDSQLSINAVEGFPLEEFSADVNISHVQSLKSPLMTRHPGCQIPNLRGTKNRGRKRK